MIRRFEPSSSADNLSITRPIQNALLHEARWSRGSTEEICVVQRKLDRRNLPNPVAQPEIDCLARPTRRNRWRGLRRASLRSGGYLFVHWRPKKTEAARVTICGLRL